MVNPTDSVLNHLAYLHDAKCSEIAWCCASQETRTLRTQVSADADSGLLLWDGKQRVIIFSDVVAVRFTGWGFVTGEENIDTWSQSVSESVDQECASLRARGISIPPLKFSITFRSGS